MRALCLYLHIHQPFRYRRYAIFDVAYDHNYWQEHDYNSKQHNERIFRKVADKSYRSMFVLLEKKLAQHAGLRFSLSVTGTWLEQAELWAPDLVAQLQRMVNSGRVEIVAETYYHSLAFFYDRAEFEAQVRLQQQRIQDLFGVKCRAFRNTELAYNDELADWAADFGFETVLAEGWDRILEWRSPNYVYQPANGDKLRLLLKNYRLSDDIAFRFSDRKWSEWPLTVDKYLGWLKAEAAKGSLINLFMDFETFGEHQWAETGIFQFIEKLIGAWLKDRENRFVTVSEAGALMQPVDKISVPSTVTWADTERDLSAWTGNAMQQEALRMLYQLGPAIIATENHALIKDFRRLTTSDHVYYMSTKYWHDGDVHAYFSPYDSPYDAFMYYLNIIKDVKDRLQRMQTR